MSFIDRTLFPISIVQDPTMPITNVPCHGCGALLQCVDTGLPGYLPSELIRYQSDAMLRVINYNYCNRCSQRRQQK